ncbi:patatin-like phospholipase family protein [Nostoc sp. FACHB-152]|uniref:patatin-like phospholipase family protein n=1 Tax=unclassified Nostoc TaxID=2593658 RepID=UPI0016882E7F|nr:MULTISPECIES: patatin-like phospholipase family protein [unclassified Nostoc]MBD2450013.1 patatin-like phospholipase family protein [Nostoc sp. FACHB-152]MBD2470133.1 patatin-like phospholipase family protein [Nostoc sp. FACHB-145]
MLNIDRRTKGIVLSLLFTVLGLLLTNFYDKWQYIFFLRMPIIVGLILVFFPLIAVKLLPSTLKNLFVLRTNVKGQLIGQLILVIVGSTLAGMATILVYNVILTNAYLRFEVQQKQALPEWLLYINGIILSLPISITSIILTKKENQHPNSIKNHHVPILIGTFLGVSIAALLLTISNFVQYILESHPLPKQILLNLIYLLPEPVRNGYIDHSNNLAPGQIAVTAFLLVMLGVYIACYFILKPQADSNRFEAPALFYVTLILTVLVLLLSGMSFFLDYSRIPVLLLFLIISISGYLFLGVDHYYVLNDEPSDAIKQEDWKDIVCNRIKTYQADNEIKTLVVVCASGGGIQAAGWISRVLAGLQEQSKLGINFTQAIGWISAVSGGSIGTMYYLDRFGEHGYPEEKDLSSIFDSAVKDSLDAVGWGLTYPDLLRFIGLPFLVPKMEDRGTAIEEDWRGELKHKKASLASWRIKVQQGKLPIPIFNATLVEDGRRFLISPITLEEDNPANSISPITLQDNIQSKSISFKKLYPDFDINIATSARLSATFPYVSPVCRPDNPKTQQNFHVADGGYFDNFGVCTNVQLLDEFLTAKSCEINKVIFLRVNAFPEPVASDQVPSAPGWIMEVIGSLQALLNVRSSTQTDNNTVSVKLLQEKWRDKVDIADFAITFPIDIDKKYTAPLSWKLTITQKEEIKRAWKRLSQYIDKEQVIKKIEEKWDEWKH